MALKAIGVEFAIGKMGTSEFDSNLKNVNYPSRAPLPAFCCTKNAKGPPIVQPFFVQYASVITFWSKFWQNFRGLLGAPIKSIFVATKGEVVPLEQYRDFRGIHVCGIVYTLTHKCCIVCHLCGTHKLFFLDFDNDTYAQNSEIIKAIRIQKNFFKILIGKSFSKIDPLSSLTDTTIVV